MKINTTYLLSKNEGSGHISSRYFIVAHSTAAPNGEAWAVAHNMKSTINTAETYVTYVVDDTSIYQVGSEGYDSWGAGSPANSMAPVQIELCEFTDKTRAMNAYKNWINLLRASAQKYGIPVIADDNSSKGIKTHSWLVTHGYSNTNHTDPYTYFNQIGISKTKFQNDIKNGFSSVSKPSNSSEGNHVNSTSKPISSAEFPIHVPVKYNVPRVIVIANKSGANLYSDEQLTKPVKVLPFGSAWQYQGESSGVYQISRSQFVDGRAAFSKSNPIAFRENIGGRVKIVLPNTHYLLSPAADAKKTGKSIPVGTILRFTGRAGRFFRLQDKVNDKTVYVTGNRAYVLL